MRAREQGRREDRGLRPWRRHLRHLDSRSPRASSRCFATKWRHALFGGDDFDQKIIDWLADEFKKEGIDLRNDRSDTQRPGSRWRRPRSSFSTQQTEVNLPSVTADASGPKHLQETLTRSKLEQLVGSLIDRTVPPMEAALKDADLSKSQVDEAILVGGQTRMPAVQQKVKDYFGKEPHKGINPMRWSRWAQPSRVV
ncbi:MAG: Hsp70 family protein [Thermomicrobiales bacterium]